MADLDGDGSNETLDYALADSDGIYETIELYADDGGSFEATEVHTSSPA